MLGYVFNPASFFLCRDHRGTLRVVVVEVHNTYGERHQYTLHRVGEDGPFVASMDKAFFVSPFIDMDARYSVHVRDDAAGLRIAISERQGGQPMLSTSLILRRIRLTDRTLLRLLLRHPLQPQRTIALIHWHALRLWLRGATFLRHGGRRARDRGPLDESDDGPGGDRDRPGRVGRTGRRADHARRRSAHPCRSPRRRVTGRPAARLWRSGVVRRSARCASTIDRRSCACSWAGIPARARRTWMVDGRARTCRRSFAWPPGIAMPWRSPVAGGACRCDSGGRSAHRARRNTKGGSRRNIEAHYDLGNDFYRLFLDETMTYSSAVFATPEQSLADAQRNKYAVMAERAGLRGGEHVLEIGSGWGGFAIYAAGELGCRVTTITISPAQHRARHRARRGGRAGRSRQRRAAATTVTSAARTTPSSRSRCSRPSAPSTSRRSSRPATGRWHRAAG